MSAPNNPRYPHTCRIIRKAETTAMVDEDMDNDPMADEDAEEVVGEETAEETSEDTVVYEGCCRAYDKNTTSDKGDVITSYRGLALPLTRDDWEKLGIAPQEGDMIVVDRGGYEEYGRVIDKNPSNFGGTHLIWRYGRN